MDRQEKLRTILATYGEEAQVRQAVEGLTELSLELQKHLQRPGDNTLRVVEAMAGAQIMLDQMRILFSKVSPALYWNFEDAIIERQMERIQIIDASLFRPEEAC